MLHVSGINLGNGSVQNSRAKSFITTSTPSSNLGYRAPPPPPGQFFMGAKLFIGTHWMRNEVVLKKLVWAM